MILSRKYHNGKIQMLSTGNKFFLVSAPCYQECSVSKKTLQMLSGVCNLLLSLVFNKQKLHKSYPDPCYPECSLKQNFSNAILRLCLRISLEKAESLGMVIITD